MLDLLYPPCCPVCRDAIGRGPCEACAVPRLQARPTPPFPVRELVHLAPYDGPWGRAVRAAKVEGDRLRLRALGHALGRRARPWGTGFFHAVVPCPSPWTRRMRRGFSPGHVVAAAVAEALDLPLVDALTVRPGRRQSSLGLAERATNLRERLGVRRGARGRVLLVDDVVTTGATVACCTRALLDRAGSEAVWALALCTTTRRHPARPRVVTESTTSVEST